MNDLVLGISCSTAFKNFGVSIVSSVNHPMFIRITNPTISLSNFRLEIAQCLKPNKTFMSRNSQAGMKVDMNLCGLKKTIRL